MPGSLTLYGIEPKQLDVGIGLSPEVEAGMEKTIGAVVHQLRHIGYEVKTHAIQSEH
jgi:Ni,Fe-hydrogenase maturation factor